MQRVFLVEKLLTATNPSPTTGILIKSCRYCCFQKQLDIASLNHISKQKKAQKSKNYSTKYQLSPTTKNTV